MDPKKWFGAVIVYTAVTLLCVYFIPGSSALWFLTAFFGFTFVAFVPGYCLVSLLFPDGRLDIIETVVLSVALSFSVAGISGLFLGLTSFGISLSTITQTLTLIVVVLAVLAFLRKTGILRLPSRKAATRNLPSKTNPAST